MPDELNRADADYERVRRRAWFKDLMARLAGRPNRLLSFEAVKKSLRLGGPVYRGVKQVPIAQIVGSVDRYRDFDSEFLPAQDRTAGRWKSIARAFYDDINLPPVRLYKVGEAYFVVDGHHRISVAREQGVEYVDAEVQEAISRVMEHRTVFAIAHRLSTVRHANQILVIDAGRVVERGTHKELYDAGGRYRRLCDMQVLGG